MRPGKDQLSEKYYFQGQMDLTTCRAHTELKDFEFQMQSYPITDISNLLGPPDGMVPGVGVCV